MSTGTFALIFALVALALIVAYLIVKPNPDNDRRIERRRNSSDRRRSQAPVVYERRRGSGDRRLGAPITLPSG